MLPNVQIRDTRAAFGTEVETRTLPHPHHNLDPLRARRLPPLHQHCGTPVVAERTEMTLEASDSPLPLPASSVHELQDLQKKGISRMRVVSASQLRDSARMALAQALNEMLGEIQICGEERQLILDRAQSHLMPSNPSIDPSPVETPEVAPASEPVSRADEAHQSQPQASASKGPLGEREKALLVQLSRLIARDWRTELATVRDSQRTQVERLEMRIEELTLALHATDHALASEDKQCTAELEVKSPFDHKKSELLDQLFQANVALRSLADETAPGETRSQDREGR